MKHLTDFSLFEEVNPRDISFVQTMDNYFTVSFEFEIETEDKTNLNIDFDALEDDDLIDDIMTDIKHELNIRKRSEKNLVEDIIQSIVEDNECLFDILNLSHYTGRHRDIVKQLKSSLMLNICGEDLIYKTSQSKKYLPNFTKKWGSKLDFVEDVTLERGIEIKPKKYLSGLSEGIEMINDFYSDLDKQDYWKFSERTGLHVNIGVANKKAEWNPIKGLLMLNDFNETETPPLVFKDMDWRMNNEFCGSLIPAIKKLDPKVIQELKKSVDLNNLKSAENILNKFLTDKIKEFGYKNFGFNITKLEHNYVEFRYVGGNIPKDIRSEEHTSELQSRQYLVC